MDVKSFNPWNRGYGAVTPRYSPGYSPFLASHGQLNRLFNDLFGDFNQPFVSGPGSSVYWPHVEVKETDKEIRVMAELPGIDEKDINVTLRDGVLTLTGEKKTESNGESNGSIYSERLHGNFERSIELGSEINSDKVSTSFKQGVLTVTFAKQTETQSQVKRILIGREGATRSM
jgi:HSP20 family protein